MRNYIDLVESFQFSMLLETPQRIAWLLQNFGAKLEARYTDELARNIIPDIVQQEIMAQEPEELSAKIVSYIMAADPSQNKAYSRWIALRYLKDNQKLEDINGNLYRTLSIFQRASQARRINGNLDAVNSFAGLYTVVEPFILGDREVSGKDDRKNKRETKVDTRVAKMWENDPMLKQARTVYDGDDYMIVIPETAEAAIYFGKNTNWCTTMTRNGYFAHYSKDGPLYIILRRRDGRKWQFHFPTQQFMDERDERIDLKEFVIENRKVFEAIGEINFSGCVGSIPLNFFSPAVMAKMNDADVVMGITSWEDFKALPKERVDQESFFAALVGTIWIAVKRGAIPDHDITQIVAYYDKLLPPDAITKYLGDHPNASPKLLKYLPVASQTMERKKIVAFSLKFQRQHDRWQMINKYIPEPWDDDIEIEYWVSRTKNDDHLRLFAVPEKYHTSEVIINTLSHFPQDIPSHENLLNGEIVSRICDTVEPHILMEVLEHLPEQYRTRELFKTIYGNVKALTKADERDDRINLLTGLATFDQSLWPSKAPKVMEKMALLNRNFYTNPEHFQNVLFAKEWVHNNNELEQLKPKDVNVHVVGVALSTPDVGYAPENRRSVYFVLDRCDINIITPQLVAEAIEKYHFVKDILVLPEPYRTPEAISVLVKQGLIPIDSNYFPASKKTPENIATIFSHIPKVINGPRLHRWNTQGTKIDNIEGLSKEWERCRTGNLEFDTAILLALINTGYGQTEDLAMIKVIANSQDEEMLNNPQILTAWLNRVESYSADKTTFDLFPKSAYTSENMAIAVKKHVIDNVPPHLRNDDVLINMLKNYGTRKKISWSTITPAAFLKAAQIDGDSCMSALEHNIPENHPIMRNVEIARVMLSKEKGSDPAPYSTITDAELKTVYGDHPERRAKWTQDCYDMAAGNVVPLADIPEKFLSDKAYQNAMLTGDKNQIDNLPNPLQWLKKHGDGLSPGRIISLLSKGFAKTDRGWLDVSKEKRETIKGQEGTYFLTGITGLKSPEAKALMIFDPEGACVNALLNNCSKDHYTYRRDNFSSEDSLTNLLPYRLLLAGAFEKHPDFVTKFASVNLSGLRLYPTGSHHHREIVPLENLPRKTIEEMSYVIPDRAQYGNEIAMIFDQNSDNPCVAVSIDKTGYGVEARLGFEEANYQAESLPRLIQLSSNLAAVLKDLQITSGQNPKFKGSFLYNKLGIRGPGKREWVSLLDKKIEQVGKLSVWSYGSGARMLVSIAHDDIGIVSTSKKEKDGSFIPEYSAVIDDSHKASISALYNSMKGKI